MATTFSDIISLAMASKIINDIRWEQDFRENAALFLRQKSKALELAIPKFNRPPEIREYLEYTSPSFDSYYEYMETAISGTECPLIVDTTVDDSTCSSTYRLSKETIIHGQIYHTEQYEAKPHIHP